MACETAIGERQLMQLHIRISAGSFRPGNPIRRQRQDSGKSPFVAAGHEDDAFRIGDEDPVVAAGPGGLDRIEIDLEDDHPEDFSIHHDRRTEIITALGRCRADREETRPLAPRRLLEIGPIAEILADETNGRIVIARGNRRAVHGHDVDVGGF
ncbi:hypothetical protein D3C87_1671770 [compost metagenome]